jgi:hypothetical protein
MVMAESISNSMSKVTVVGRALLAIMAFIFCALLAIDNVGCKTSQATPSSTTEPAVSSASGRVHLVFVPGATGGSDWSRFMPLGNSHSIYFLRARVQPGGQFPVQDCAGVTLLNVEMVTGDDNHVAIDVRDTAKVQRIDLPRGQNGVTVYVAAGEFGINYPSLDISATDAKAHGSTTDIATIYIFHVFR